MNREQFIREYLNQWKIPRAWLTERGFQSPDLEGIAVRCRCGSEDCTGWAMLLPEDVQQFRKAYG